MITKFIQTKAKVLNNGKLERVDVDLLYNNEKQKRNDNSFAQWEKWWLV